MGCHVLTSTPPQPMLCVCLVPQGLSQQIGQLGMGGRHPTARPSLRRWQAATHQLPHDPEEWALVHVAHWLKQLGEQA
eukprot:COSAG01_NODE_272_length_19747_cov_298.524023_4_plen_78_part_00